jgi:hypothetical protein
MRSKNKGSTKVDRGEQEAEERFCRRTENQAEKDTKD